MPYPMFARPSLDEFEAELIKRYGVVRRSDPGVADTLANRLGRPAFSDYWERTVDGRVYFAMVPDLPGSAHIKPTRLRSLCLELKIPLTDWGFTLEEEQ